VRRAQAGVLYNILLETQTCEVSQRIIAMDNASTNAGEMVGRFTLFYNRYALATGSNAVGVASAATATAAVAVVMAVVFVAVALCRRASLVVSDCDVFAVPVRRRSRRSCQKSSPAPSLSRTARAAMPRAAPTLVPVRVRVKRRIQ
jgi:hypothetical protein